MGVEFEINANSAHPSEFQLDRVGAGAELGNMKNRKSLKNYRVSQKKGHGNVLCISGLPMNLE